MTTSSSMWGDPDRASSLEANDPLATLLFQISSPAHIPFGDTRWQELLHGYEVWVHVEYTTDTNSIIYQTCTNMVKHAATSSNLAAFSLHVGRMLRGLVLEFETNNTTTTNSKSKTTTTTTTSSSVSNASASRKSSNSAAPQNHEVFAQRISRVAKARATSGALQLLRLLVHAVVVASTTSSSSLSSSSLSSPNETLQEAFTYHTRGDLTRDRNAGVELFHAILDLVSSSQKESQLTTPEVYDVMVLSLQLLLVLCSTQLYQPFQSSFQETSSQQNDDDDEDDDEQSIDMGQQRQQQQQQHSFHNHYFLRLLYQNPRQSHHSNASHHDSSMLYASTTSFNTEASKVSSSSSSSSKKQQPKWTPLLLLETLLEWQVKRPVAPPGSIAHGFYNLAQSIVATKGEPIGGDGMYENHMVVMADSTMTASTNSLQQDLLAQSTNKQQKQNHYQQQQKHLQQQQQQQQQQPHVTLPNNQQLTIPSALYRNDKAKMILDATRGVLVLSSSIIMLPLRLMRLVLGVWGHGHKSNNWNKQRFHGSSSNSRTKDVMWLSESPLADLASSFLLIVVNNNRNSESHLPNPFRSQLKNMTDNRWDTSMERSRRSSGSFNASFVLPDLPANMTDLDSSFNNSNNNNNDSERQALLTPLPSKSQHSQQQQQQESSELTMNFESLFNSFGKTVHTEMGALSLYTLIQSSPNFAESLAVRSDLDTLILPLLRTLYFASASRIYVSQDFATGANNNNNNRTMSRRQSNESIMTSNSSKNQTSTTNNYHHQVDIRNCPFRSQSQLYVIIILLLLFSQDSSFGRDAFRRTTIANVQWYKERNLRNINLGSVLLLTLFRSLTFNLNRLHDPFLLSNCCAILMNLSPSIVDLHEYAAMRLASVTVSCLKRYMKLYADNLKEQQDKQNGNNTTNNKKKNNDRQEEDEDEEDLTTPLGMYGEVSRTLLQVLKHCISSRNLERNLHLVYALVYHQGDLQKPLKSSDKTNPFTKSETSRIQAIVSTASTLIQKDGARTAAKALKVLEENQKEFLQTLAQEKKKKTTTTKQYEGSGDFTFTYEEESDPEIFFVPYLWEVIVCVATSSSMEWDKNQIQVFPLLEKRFKEEENENNNNDNDDVSSSHNYHHHVDPKQFSKDVMDVV